MTTFVKCQILMNRILTRAAECFNDRKLSDEFVSKQIKELNRVPENWIKEHGSFKIQPDELTDKEMDVLGFGRFKKDDVNRLIPLWMFPYLCDDIKTTCIDGSECLSKKDMDDDHRFGYLAYGIKPCDK